MDTGLRTSTNSGLAGGLAVLVIWAIGVFSPGAMETAPVGLEAALTAILMTIVGRFSATPKTPGVV